VQKAAGNAVSRSVGSQLVANAGSESEIGHPGDPEVADSFGGPSRTRTLDPLIRRPVPTANGPKRPQTAPRSPRFWSVRLGTSRPSSAGAHGQKADTPPKPPPHANPSPDLGYA
jgi:hypothetical protein